MDGHAVENRVRISTMTNGTFASSCCWDGLNNRALRGFPGTDSFPSNAGGPESELSPPGLTPGCWQGSSEDSGPHLLQLLGDCIPWLRVSFLHLESQQSWSSSLSSLTSFWFSLLAPCSTFKDLLYSVRPPSHLSLTRLTPCQALLCTEDFAYSGPSAWNALPHVK